MSSTLQRFIDPDGPFSSMVGFFEFADKKAILFLFGKSMKFPLHPILLIVFGKITIESFTVIIGFSVKETVTAYSEDIKHKGSDPNNFKVF